MSDDLRRFIEQQMERAGRTEQHAITGDNRREQARAAGRYTAFEMILRKLDEIDTASDIG